MCHTCTDHVAEAAPKKPAVTLADLQGLAARQGGRCVNPEIYQNKKTKLTWECGHVEKHQWQASWDNLRNGAWCKACNGKLPPTAAQFQAKATERGGCCVDPDTYTDSHSLLTWECGSPARHRWRATWGNVRRGSWCRACAGLTAPSVERITKTALALGGRCLNPEAYRNAHAKLLWECGHRDQHQWWAPWDYVRQGRWCKVCSGCATPTPAQIQAKAVEKGGRCVNPEAYRTAHTKLTWECGHQEKHHWQAPWGSIQQGKWCAVCAGITKPTMAQLQAKAAEKGGRCLNPEAYRTANERLKWECGRAHRWNASWSSINGGSWCPHCINKTEALVRMFLETVYQLELLQGTPNFLKKSGGPRKSYILDGYNETAKLAFEYHGIQHYEYCERFHFTPDSGKLEQQIARDSHVREQCAANAYDYLEIRYVHKDKVPTPDEVVEHCRPYVEAHLQRAISADLVAKFLCACRVGAYSNP